MRKITFFLILLFLIIIQPQTTLNSPTRIDDVIDFDTIQTDLDLTDTIVLANQSEITLSRAFDLQTLYNFQRIYILCHSDEPYVTEVLVQITLNQNTVSKRFFNSRYNLTAAHLFSYSHSERLVIEIPKKFPVYYLSNSLQLHLSVQFNKYLYAPQDFHIDNVFFETIQIPILTSSSSEYYRLPVELTRTSYYVTITNRLQTRVFVTQVYCQVSELLTLDFEISLLDKTIPFTLEKIEIKCSHDSQMIDPKKENSTTISTNISPNDSIILSLSFKPKSSAVDVISEIDIVVTTITTYIFFHN